MRPSAAPGTHPPAPDVRRFADDVAYYLSQVPRQLPSRYLYDDLGSALFESICHLPWYRITSIEAAMLRACACDILGRPDAPSTLVELGPGSGAKLAALLREAAPRHPGMTVHLVDVSRAALDTAAAAIAGDGVAVVAHQAEYEEGLHASVRDARGRSLVLFLGSNIGNYDSPGADAFLESVRTAVGPGGQLLLGTDLVKPEADLLRAYDDPLGVTAAFNRNLLVRLNRELDADFDLPAFSHRAVWNPVASRVEMHLVSLRRQRVRVGAAGLDFVLEDGETIWTESSYKYRPDGVIARLSRSGFRTLHQWTREQYALTLAQAAR
jgi:L-histidine N-alpha-methyltransferase